MSNEPRKKVPSLLTFILGLIVGAAIIGALAFFGGVLNKEEKPPKVTQETEGLLLSVSKPADGDFITSPKLEISGTTGKDAIIAVTGVKNDVIIETSSGKFSTIVQVNEGVNQLTIFAFNPEDGGSVQESFDILYVNEKTAFGQILIAEASTTNDENQTTINDLRENLSTKSSSLKQPSNFKKTFVYGTITSINNPLFTLVTAEDGTKTAMSDELTNFYLQSAKTKSAITFDDLKIGDMVAVAGIGKDDNFGTAKYVLVNKKISIKRYVFAGEVKKIAGSNITLSYINQADLSQTVAIDKNTQIKIKGKESASVSDININDILVTTGNIAKTGKLEAKNIFVVPAKKTQTPSATSSSKNP